VAYQVFVVESLKLLPGDQECHTGAKPNGIRKLGNSCHNASRLNPETLWVPAPSVHQLLSHSSWVWSPNWLTVVGASDRYIPFLFSLGCIWLIDTPFR